jgi:predicted GNAT superfamily acetyltransferase
MDDAFNRGDESDRCVVAWRLRSGRAVAAAGTDVEPSEPERAVRVLAPRSDGTPECLAPAGGEAVLLAWVPEDITTMRARDAANARAWRLAARDSLGRAIGAGYTATAMLRSGWYVLERRT